MTAVDCLIEQLTNEGIYIPFGFYEQAKQMEHQQQVDLLNFSKEMCTPEAPVDYIIKEFEKWKKQQ